MDDPTSAPELTPPGTAAGSAGDAPAVTDGTAGHDAAPAELTDERTAPLNADDELALEGAEATGPNVPVVSESTAPEADTPEEDTTEADPTEADPTEADPTDNGESVDSAADPSTKTAVVSASSDEADADSDVAGSEAEAAAASSAAADARLVDRAAEEGVSMMELLLEEGGYMPDSFERGATLTGTLLRKENDQWIVDVGAKREGVVPAGDLSKLPADFLSGVKIGDSVEVTVLKRPVADGDLIVSIGQALLRHEWKRAQEVMDSGEVLELPITSYNKGGVVVDFGPLQGFIPKSQLANIGRFGDAPDVMDRLKAMVGSVIGAKIIEVSRRERRLIMSERRASREWRAAQKRDLLADLKEGDIRKGRVSSIADFGVFVDLGGADGLVHISEVSHDRGKHPRELVKVGQEVDVYVLALDDDRRRIGLSMRRLLPDPWSTAEDDHYIGQICDAEVTNLTKFGAFAQLPTGLEGLIHVSEISDDHVEHPREAVRPGQRVTVEILSIEPERQRIGLSVRRVPEHLRTEYPPEINEVAPDEVDERAESAATASNAAPTQQADTPLPEQADTPLPEQETTAASPELEPAESEPGPSDSEPVLESSDDSGSAGTDGDDSGDLDSSMHTEPDGDET